MAITKKIASGDTLSKIATQFGTTVDAIMALNKNNPSVKSKDLIIAGGSLNLPDAPVAPPNSATQGVTTPKVTPTVAQTGAGSGQPVAPSNTGSSVLPTSIPDSGMSASFLSGMSKDIDTATKNLENIFAPPPEPGSTEELSSPAYRALQSSKAGTKASFDAAREDITDQALIGNIDRAKARELLGLSPAAIRSSIEKFTVQSDNFDKSIARSIERLTMEEQAALDNEDYQYAQQLRQQKIDFTNAQLQASQTRMNFLTTAFNMLLGEKQYQQQSTQFEQTQASNRLNLMLQAGGGNFDKMSPAQQATLANDAQVLGIPLDTVKEIISSPQVKFHVVKGNSVYLFDAAGRLVNSINVGGGSGRGSGDGTSDYFRGYLSGDIPGVSSVPADQKDAFMSKLTSIKDDAVGSLVWNERNALGSAADIGKQSPEDVKKDIAKRVAEQVFKSPGTITKILGGDKGYSSIDDGAKINEVVDQYVDALIPDDYVLKVMMKAKNPFVSAFSNDNSNNVDTSQPTITFGDQ
jgi:hypothetical protein